jgi:hypothetical protein
VKALCVAATCLAAACGSAEPASPECLSDEDCDPRQICGERGMTGHVEGECAWVAGRTFAVTFVSATVSSEGPEGPWDEDRGIDGPEPDPQAGFGQGVDEPEPCTGIGGDSFEVTFGSDDTEGSGTDCFLTVYPGQPLTLFLWDFDWLWDLENTTERVPIDTWTFEGEEGYGELLREPSNRRLEGEWSSVFISVTD